VIVALVVLIFFMFLYVPFSIGEKRARQREVGYLDKLINVSRRIEQAVDVSDIDGSRNALEKLRNDLHGGLAEMEQSLAVRATAYNDVVGFDHTDDIDTAEDSIKDLLSSEISYRNKLKRYIERVDFVLNENTTQVYSELDKIATDWQRYLEQDKQAARKKESFTKGVAGSLTAIFATLNSIFGVPLSDLLSKLGLLG
jgi:hypothetical protein